MADEQKPAEGAKYVPFIDRIAEGEEEGRQNALKRRAAQAKSPVATLSPRDIEIAQALIRLSGNLDFKIFLEMEAMEISDRFISAFQAPAKADFPSTNFAEQMAYNKGRLDQMKNFQNNRNSLINAYLNMERRDREQGGDNGTH